METILIFGVGAVAGAAGMYLIARNSPEHFLKFKGYADKVDQAVRDQVSKASAKIRAGK